MGKKKISGVLYQWRLDLPAATLAATIFRKRIVGIDAPAENGIVRKLLYVGEVGRYSRDNRVIIEKKQWRERWLKKRNWGVGVLWSEQRSRVALCLRRTRGEPAANQRRTR